MGNDFTAVMKEKSNSELLEIVTKYKDDYQPEALEAAQIELESRALTDEDIEQAKSEVGDKEKALEDKQSEPLGIGQRLLFFLFFWGVVTWTMAGTLKNNGYNRKYKDAWRSMGFGALFFLGIPLIIVLVYAFFY